MLVHLITMQTIIPPRTPPDPHQTPDTHSCARRVAWCQTRIPIDATSACGPALGRACARACVYSRGAQNKKAGVSDIASQRCFSPFHGFGAVPMA